MNVQAPSTPMWPFAVARGRRFGYRVMVAPDFLCASKEAGLLYPIIEGAADDEPIAGTQTRVLRTAAGQTLTAFYRESGVEAADLGLAAGALRDEGGRLVTVFEGYVVAGQIAGEAGVDWTPARSVANESVRRLLAAEAARTSVTEIPIMPSQAVPGPISIHRRAAGVKPLLVTVAVGAVVAVVAVVAVIIGVLSHRPAR